MSRASLEDGSWPGRPRPRSCVVAAVSSAVFVVGSIAYALLILAAAVVLSVASGIYCTFARLAPRGFGRARRKRGN